MLGQRCASCLPHAGIASKYDCRWGLRECDDVSLCLRISFRTAEQELRIKPCFYVVIERLFILSCLPLPPRTTSAKQEGGCALARRVTVGPIYHSGRLSLRVRGWQRGLAGARVWLPRARPVSGAPPPQPAACARPPLNPSRFPPRRTWRRV